MARRRAPPAPGSPTPGLGAWGCPCSHPTAEPRACGLGLRVSRTASGGYGGGGTGGCHDCGRGNLAGLRRAARPCGGTGGWDTPVVAVPAALARRQPRIHRGFASGPPSAGGGNGTAGAATVTAGGACERGRGKRGGRLVSRTACDGTGGCEIPCSAPFTALARGILPGRLVSRSACGGAGGWDTPVVAGPAALPRR